MPRRNFKQQKPENVVNALRQAHGLVTVAAKMLGCTTQTVYDHIERSPEVKKVWEDCGNEMLDRAEARLFQAIDAGERWAITFYLKNKGRARGYFERTEITSPEALPVKFTLDMGNSPKP